MTNGQIVKCPHQDKWQLHFLYGRPVDSADIICASFNLLGNQDIQ